MDRGRRHTHGLRAGSRRAGLTIVEMLVATAIAMLALSMFGSMVLNTNRAREMNHEEALAGRAVANLLERMHDEDFFELFALYNDDPEDDPEGPGTAVGSRFDVDGLFKHRYSHPIQM